MQTADFYSSATGTLRVNGGRDENAPQGVSLSIDDLSYIKQGSKATDSGGTGTTDYNELANKPQINNITLESNKTAAQLGLATTSDISNIKQVPIVTSSDNNKVLTASYSGGIASYAWIPASSGGTSDYTELSNKPQINSITLTGNKSLNDLGIQPKIDSSHKVSADNIDDTNTTNKFATAAQLTQIETNKNNILLLEQLNGRKNVLQYDALETTNANDVTYTINDDYSITVTDNPSRNGTSYVILKLGSGYAFVDDYCNGNYKLYGCPSGGSESTYWIYVSAGDYYKADTGSGIILTPTSEIGIRVILRLSGEYISSPITFKPMICRKELDSTYDAYAMTTGELTTAIRGLLANS